MTREPQDTSAEEPDGGNLHVRFRGGPGRDNRPGLLNQIAAPRSSADRAWLALRLSLWPDASEPEHLRGMSDTLARGHFVRLAVLPDGSTVGFVEASKRVDYVNGTTTSPVAFLEGLYVAPQARRKGVARALVETVVKWALGEGCTELASDALLDNTAAHAAHRALGFEETERVVYFLRALDDREAKRFAGGA